MQTVYFDNNATTRTADEVREAMLPFFGELYGNPSSMHAFGGGVAKHLAKARERVAAFLNCSPEEILQRFTRGDKARTGQGSGLGLAIAKTYTEAVGGHFHVEVSGDQFRAVVTVPRLTRTD